MIPSLFSDDWMNILSDDSKTSLESLLLEPLKAKRWFGGKNRIITSISVSETIPIPYGSKGAQLLFVRVAFTEGSPETYLLPITIATGAKARWIQQEYPSSIFANLTTQEDGPNKQGILFDPLCDSDFSSYLLDSISNKRNFAGRKGMLTGTSTTLCKMLLQADPSPPPTLMKTEQSNTSISYGRKVILKLYRRLEEGGNPELEIGRLLTQMNAPFIPKLAGTLVYQPKQGESITVGVLQEFIENVGDAWTVTCDSLESFFDNAPFNIPELPQESGQVEWFLDQAYRTYPPSVQEMVGPYLNSAKLLGQCTAELHQALSLHPNLPDFAPEKMSEDYLHHRHDCMTQLTTRTLGSLEKHLPKLSSPTDRNAQEILSQQDRLLRTFDDFLTVSHSCKRIRCHGDYHLGQVLWTGQKFIILDFEGEPARSFQERKAKHSPLIDVTSMLRSFHYAPYAQLSQRLSGARSFEHQLEQEKPWAEFWYHWVAVSFLRGYLPLATSSNFWPASWSDVKTLFKTHLIEKAIYELAYELNNRPDWVSIPLQGLRHLLNQPTSYDA